MNEPARIPAPDFQDQLNALAEEMADGLGRQTAIDRLVDLGLDEDEADDQEAAIREQLRAIHRGANAIFRDLERGLNRQQAVVRFQELGLSRDDAVQALDSYRQRKESALQETRTILDDIHRGLGRSDAAARFQGLGLSGPAAAQFVGLRFDATAHWYGEFTWLGVLSALIGAALFSVVLCSGPQPLVAALIPAGLVLCGTFLGIYGWRQWHRYRPARSRPESPSPFDLARQGHGRLRAIVCAAEAGVAPGEAALLVHSSLDGVVRLYRWFVVLGVAAMAWGVLEVWRAAGLQEGSVPKCFVALTLVLWGAAGAVRGVMGWRRFARA